MVKIAKQLFRFGFSGIVVTLLDFAIVYLLGTYTGFPVLVVTFLSYLVSMVVNYFLTVKWVFETDGNHKRNMTVFFVLGIVALGITQLVMWLGTSVFDYYFMAVKVVATISVNVFNFISRKLLLERR